jgi:hypothetical protein
MQLVPAPELTDLCQNLNEQQIQKLIQLCNSALLSANNISSAVLALAPSQQRN